MDLKTLISQAYKDHFAVGAFNVYNLETIQAVAQAANNTGKPVIMQLSEKALEYAGFDQILGIFKRARIDSRTPIYLHLDHGRNPALAKDCIANKFDSVMFDGSALPIEQNIEISSSIRKYAHQRGVIFEAEIGKIGGKEDRVSSAEFKTSPEEALEVHEKVKPDMLAVAIGNVHGVLTANEQLDFSLLAKISGMVRAPLVLHGCSNRAEREYRVAISEGVVKINIDTELRQAFVEGLKKALRKKESDPRSILTIAKAEVTKQTEGKIDIFSKGCC
jgi:fructose-bisphosphate aldolase class II